MNNAFACMNIQPVLYQATVSFFLVSFSLVVLTLLSARRKKYEWTDGEWKLVSWLALKLNCEANKDRIQAIPSLISFMLKGLFVCLFFEGLFFEGCTLGGF